MTFHFLLLATSLLALAVTPHTHAAKQAGPPPFSPVYKVTGVLSLPYAEIKEPFVAYYDAPNKKSRVDYYDGVQKTFQRADITPFGVSRKLVPFTNDSVTNMEMCFEANGTKDGAIMIQTVLPNLTHFVMTGKTTYRDMDCTVWRFQETIGKKVNKYMFLMAEGPLPVLYEMKGYDTLLGSHYDHYYVDYLDYTPSNSLDPNIFDITNMTCRGFPGPGLDHTGLMSPIGEYVHSAAGGGHNGDYHDDLFAAFVRRHERKFHPNSKEHRRRINIFKHNVRYIHSHNRAAKPYKMAINHFADRTDDEIRSVRGRLYSKERNHGRPFDMSRNKMKDVPTSKDWRLYGAVTPVKDQAVCGSCWSFGTTGTIEGTWFLKTGQLLRLSQQSLMDCSWGEGNNACDGGEEWRAYDWMIKHGGMMSEDSYGMYTGADGKCHFNASMVAVRVKSYVNVTSGDEMALTAAIAYKGPVSVGIDASHKSFAFYANGVYYEPACGNKESDLDHAVLAVGYGVMGEEKYWLVKNSWSTYWGNDGYVLMSQRDNNCGVATDATYVMV